MHQVLHIRQRMQGLLATLLAALALAVQPLAAQVQDAAVRIEEQKTPALQPLTAAEIDQATTLLQSDPRIRTRLAQSQRVRTVFVERREEDKNAPTGQRRADVVLYNYDTNETISAVVILGPSPSVEHMAITKDQQGGLGPQEVEEAQYLALAHPTVQEQLRAAGLSGRESELIITHLRAQAAARDDPCATHRCVMLSFNMRDAVLNIAVVVDLTTRQVAVQ